MKTIRCVLVILLTGFYMGSNAQTDKELLFSGEFTFTYADKVKIKAGGAVASKTRKELQSGTKVGDVSIDPAVYKKMENETGTQFRIEIKKYGKGNFREITLTNLQKKQSIKGLYDITTREMLFASAKGKKTGNDCGSIGMGVIKGRLSADMKRIENGEFAIGFIAGCNPVLVGASVTFYYNATTRTETASLGNARIESGELWSAAEDTVWIKDRLLSCRWQPVRWINNGTEVKTRPEDFGHFYSNGSYECALLSTYDKGTWSYDGKLNAIHLVLSKTTATYFIDEITDSTLVCSSFDGQCEMKKFSYKNNPRPSHENSNRATLLCKTWKIDAHKKGVLPVNHAEGDFIRMHQDGRYEQVVFNTYKTGTWHLTELDKKITVDCGGFSIWEIKSISEKEIVLARPNETLTIVK